MVVGFREREVVMGGWSESYYDLHDGLFSVCQKGLVVLHCENVWLKDCKFSVQPKGLEKVRETGVKNVHAYVRGHLISFDMDLTDDPQDYLLSRGYRQAYYNPRKVDSFIDCITLAPLDRAGNVILVDKKIFYI